MNGYLVLELFRFYNRSKKLSREYSSYSLTEAIKDQENARYLLQSFHPETIILAEEHIKYLVKKLQISKDNSSSSLTVLSFLLLVVVTALFVNIPQLIEIAKQKYSGDFLGKNKISDIVTKASGVLGLIGIILLSIRVTINFSFERGFQNQMTRYEKCLSLLEKAKIMRDTNE